MFLIGPLIALLTFPGVIVHGLAHQLLCRWNNVAVLRTCYFRLENCGGYVIHEIPTQGYQSLLIGIGPFLINTIVGALIAFPAALPFVKFSDGDPLDSSLFWLGVSIAMHAIPTRGVAKVAKGIQQAVVRDKGSIWRKVFFTYFFFTYAMVSVPIVFFSLALIYGIAVAMALPTLCIFLLA
jgi:Putative zincin peptidase